MKKFAEFFKENTTKIAVALLIIMSVILLAMPDDNPSRGQGRAAAKKAQASDRAAGRPDNCFFILDKARDFIKDNEKYNKGKDNFPLADISRTWAKFYRGTLEKKHGPAPLIRKRGKCYPSAAASDFDRWFETVYKAKLWPKYIERSDRPTTKERVR